MVRLVGILIVTLLLPHVALGDDPEYDADERSHWALQPRRQVAAPAVASSERVRTPVDAFVLRRLEERGLSLASPSPRATVLRRLTFDLPGLPPTPKAIEEFSNDPAPDAVERLVRVRQFMQHVTHRV